MNKGTLTVIGLSCAIALSAGSAADNSPASEASIKQLLEVGQVHKLVDTTMEQMDAYMKQITQQAVQGQRVSPETQKYIDRAEAEMMAAVREVLDWKKLEPMYVRVYQKTFTQEEVDGLIGFYKTPTGQALLTKMPAVMQNTLNEMQQIVQPMMQRMQQMQQQIVAEIEAEKKKKHG